MPQGYVPHPDLLRGQDYGIIFLRPSKAGQRNEAKYAKYSKATTSKGTVWTSVLQEKKAKLFSHGGVLKCFRGQGG